jgi:metal-responsive CopG/Arc/MetJ family transcriptional regulator
MGIPKNNAEKPMVKLVVSIPPDIMTDIDGIVREAKGGMGEVSRSTFVRAALVRAVKDAKRPR